MSRSIDLPPEPELTTYLAGHILDLSNTWDEKRDYLLEQLEGHYPIVMPFEREPDPLTEDPYPIDACRWIGEQVLRGAV